MKKLWRKNKVTIILLFFLIGWSLLSLTMVGQDLAFDQYDTITIFFYVIANSILNFIQILAPIFIAILVVSKFHKELHEGVIKSYLTRQTYRKYLVRILKLSLKASLLYVVVMGVLFGACFLVTRSFDYQNVIPKVIGYTSDGAPILTGTISTITLSFYKNPIGLMLTFFGVIILHSMMYANIALIMCKRNRNAVVAVISSFLVFIFIAIISEVGLGQLFIKKLGMANLSGIFNLIGIWVYCDYTSFMPLFVYSFILAMLSYVALYVTYRNKEKVLIASEA